jgi:hypothetical protein
MCLEDKELVGFTLTEVSSMFDFDHPAFQSTLDKYEALQVDKVREALIQHRPAALAEATRNVQASCRNNAVLAGPLMEAAQTMSAYEGDEKVRSFFLIKALSAAQTAMIHGPKGAQIRVQAGAFILDRFEDTVVLLGAELAARMARDVMLHAPEARKTDLSSMNAPSLPRLQRTPDSVWNSALDQIMNPQARIAELQAARDAVESSSRADLKYVVDAALHRNLFLLAQGPTTGYVPPRRQAPQGATAGTKPQPQIPSEGPSSQP